MANESGNGGPTATVIIKRDSGNALGIASFVFGLISIFTLAPIFVPLAVIVGIIAVIQKQLVWGILGLVCAIVGFATSPILLGLVGFATIGANPKLLPDPTTLFPQLTAPPRQAPPEHQPTKQAMEAQDNAGKEEETSPQVSAPAVTGQQEEMGGGQGETKETTPWYSKPAMPGLDRSVKPAPGKKDIEYRLAFEPTKVCGPPPSSIVTVQPEDMFYWLRNEVGGQLLGHTRRGGTMASKPEALPVPQADLLGGVVINGQAYDHSAGHITDPQGCLNIRTNWADWLPQRYPVISTRPDPNIKAKDDPTVTLAFEY